MNPENHSQRKISLDEAYQFIAALISSGHHVYLPIFDRLDKELAKTEAQLTLIEKAQLIASQKNPIRDNHSDF